MSDLKQELRQFIDENFLFGVPTPYTNDDSLLENSIIDSTGVLELIAHLEGTYGFRVTDDELIPENLDSVDAIVQFINEKSAGVAG